MSSGGGGGDTTQIQKADPWARQQPYLTSGFSQALENYNTPYEYYPGQTFVPRGQYELGADYGMLQYANQGMIPQAAQAVGTQSQMLNAPDLANNPYVAQYTKAMNERLATDFNQNVMPGIRGDAVAAGQVGSSRQGVAEGLASQGLSRAMADQTAQFYNQAYGQGLDQQVKAMALAPQTMGLGLMPYQTMAEVGGRFTGDQQQYLNEDMARWQFAQSERDAALSRYMSTIRGDFGGSTTTTGPNPNASSPLANAAGGAMTGGALAGATMGSAAGPWGMAAGAVIGLLMS
jgi:hypothetical protein